MAKILSVGQSYLEGHFVEMLHLVDDKLETLSTTLQSVENLVDAAQQTALQATTNATQALNTASTALATGQNAVDRLAGDGDFFIGTFPLFTRVGATKPTAITVNSYSGISWDNSAKKFNFSYLGWYYFEIETFGDFVNSRSDWYQEFSVRWSKAGTPVSNEIMRLVPSITQNIRKVWTKLIKVNFGDVLYPEYFHNTSGSINSGAFATVTIKKVI